MKMTPQSRRRLLFNGLFVFTAAFIMWAVSTCNNKSKTKKTDDATATYVAKGDSLFPIRILVDLSPDNFSVEENGKVGGLQVKLAKQIFEGMVIRWIPVTDQASAFEQLRKGEADIYAGSFSLSQKAEFEKQGLAVSQALFDNSLVLISRVTAISPMDPNVGDTVLHILVSKSDLAAQIILGNIIELAYPNLSQKIIEKSELDLVLEVVKNTEKYAVINRRLAEEMVGKYPNEIRLIQDISFDTQQAWLVQPGDSAVLHLLNDKIADNLDRKQ